MATLSCLFWLAGCLPTSTALADAPLSWSAPATVDPGNVIEAVSCPSEALCVAVDNDGNVLTTTNPTGGAGSWTVTEVDSGTALRDVSCPSGGLCVATDIEGKVLSSIDPTGGTGAWSAAKVDGTEMLGGVSCASPSLCVAIDRHGKVVTSSEPTAGSAAWTVAEADPANSLEGVSCVSSLCVATDSEGDIVSSSEPTGGASAWTVSMVDLEGIAAVSCPTSSLCVAVGGGGQALTSQDPTAGVGAWTSTSVDSDYLDAVSCTPSSLCVAVDSSGNAASTTNPTGGAGAWTTAEIDGTTLYGVSCPTASLCVAGDTDGQAVVGTATTGPGGGGPIGPVHGGELALSPAGVYSAASVECSGAKWSIGSVVTQWLLDGEPIPGANATTYVPPRADDGHQLSCRQTASADELSATLTSVAGTVHEQPPVPSAKSDCLNVCMIGQGTFNTPYLHEGTWTSATAVGCQSGAWTSAAGDSGESAIAVLAEAHTVRVTIQRITPAGTTTVAHLQVGELTRTRDEAVWRPGDEYSVSVGYGPALFASEDVAARGFPSTAIGKPNIFAAGQGEFYYLAKSSEARYRTFELIYNLAAADLGARLRCTVEAEDGPASAPSVGAVTTSEATVSSNPICAPIALAPGNEPQPVYLPLSETAKCLLGGAEGIKGLGHGAETPVLKLTGAVAEIAFNCNLPGGCDGNLSLLGTGAHVARSARRTTTAGLVLASRRIDLRRGGRRVFSLRLTPRARKLLRRAGRSGLAATLTLTVRGRKHTIVKFRMSEAAHR